MKKPPINNRIRAKEVRLIDEDGSQVGVVPLDKAIETAKGKNLDLIQVTDKVSPPVCKIGDYGKHLYRLKKKESSAKHKKSETKGIRLSFKISEHDMETRMKQAAKFLNKGDKIKIELRLRGREKAHQDVAREKVKKFVEQLNNLIPVKMEREIKKEPRGLVTIVSKN